MAWRCREPMGSSIMDDNQSQFDFITGQEEEIIEELLLMDLRVTRSIRGVGESISPPPLFHFFESSTVTRTT